MARLRNYIRRYTSISAVLDVLVRKQLPLLDPQTWDDRNDRYFMSLYKEKRELGGLYGLCAATCSETYHHWRVFTGTADGACLELRRQPLEAMLRELEGVRFGEVDYLHLDKVEELTPKDVQRLPFVKRLGFTAEAEYRITAETTEPQLPALSIDLPLDLIGRVELNPWLPASLAESVTKTLKGLPGCEKLPIRRSRLIDSDRWKKAGDRVVGRTPPAKLRIRRTKKV